MAGTSPAMTIVAIFMARPTSSKKWGKRPACLLIAEPFVLKISDNRCSTNPY